MLALGGVAQHTPQFELFVDDLALLSDEALSARALSAMPLLATAMLRDSRNEAGLLSNLARWATAIRELLDSPAGLDDLRFLLAYIATVSDLDIEAMRATIIEHVPEAQPTVMTLAERLIQQGREEGREQGQAAMLVNMLALKFGPLDEAAAARVHEASAQERDRIAKRLLEADSLDAVFTD